MLGGHSEAARVEHPQVGLGVYTGLFFTTLSTLMYEVLLTRIFSVTMWYHFAFVAVSVALFGMTVGALIVYLSPERFPVERTKERLSQASILFSVSLVLSFVTVLAIPFDAQWSLISVYSIGLTYVVTSIPFILSGIVVSLALTRFPHRVSRLYGVDLVGAALGTVTLIWLLGRLGDAPSAVLAVAALAAVAALMFAQSERRTRAMAIAAGAVVVFAWMAGANAVLAREHNAPLRVRWIKGESESKPIFERWNAFSRIMIAEDVPRERAPIGWGLSPTYPASSRVVRQLVLNIDASSGTVVTEYDGSPQNLEHLRYDVTNLVHYIRPRASVFVVGSGGGRDVLSALAFEQPAVTAVELNGDILKAVNRTFGEFSGHLDRQRGVTFVNDEARSYLARSDDKFDIIQLSLIDTWAATAAGAFALAENSVYTLEAWDIFLHHLSERGVLSVSRWYTGPRPMEAYRLTSLATKALLDFGVSRPQDHLMLIRSPENTFGFGVGTLLVSREPFAKSDVTRMREVAALMQFEVVLAPGLPATDPTFDRLVQSSDPGSVSVGFAIDLSPPTDDRPFFFQMIRFRDVFDTSLYQGNDTRFLTKPVLVLFSLAVTVVALTALCIILPLLRSTRRAALRGMLPLLVFFSGIGLGFMLLEISQLQRLTIFLGHPTYALSVVLFSLLLASGAGSLATERLVNPGLRPSLLWPFAVLLLVLIASGILTPQIIDRFDSATTEVRILAAAGILAPMGVVMGMPFPVGMKVASLSPRSPTVFFWGVNGATSVCASVLAVAIAMAWGISMAFWVGCLSYLAASAALGMLALRRRIA